MVGWVVTASPVVRVVHVSYTSPFGVSPVQHVLICICWIDRIVHVDNGGADYLEGILIWLCGRERMHAYKDRRFY